PPAWPGALRDDPFEAHSRANGEVRRPSRSSRNGLQLPEACDPFLGRFLTPLKIKDLQSLVKRGFQTGKTLYFFFLQMVIGFRG
ncbi:hypothetical protein, partial [Escherichia coli]|uniref:hypothetical protein n=1 Tax=Escherichia coli TaxID=562 RepID=UPI001952AF2D